MAWPDKSLPTKTCRIAAVIAFALFIKGAASNATGERETSMLGLCYVLKDGIFAGAAVLTLAATALGLTSYILLRRQPAAAAAAASASAVHTGDEQVPAGAVGIAMGKPQFPQQPAPQGYGQAPPPNYPQYSPAPQGYGQFPPATADGYGAHAPNQQFPPPPPPAQGYGAHAPNQQYPPPAHGYAPNQQFGSPAHGYAPNQQYTPPPTQGYAAPQEPNQQAQTPQEYEQVEQGPEVAAEVAQGEPDGGAWTSEPVGDAETTQ
jgi:hypothetical protein